MTYNTKSRTIRPLEVTAAPPSVQLLSSLPYSAMRFPQPNIISDETLCVNRAIRELKLEVMRVCFASNANSDEFYWSREPLRQPWPSMVSSLGERIWLPQLLSPTYPHPNQSAKQQQTSKAMEMTTSALTRISI